MLASRLEGVRLPQTFCKLPGLPRISLMFPRKIHSVKSGSSTICPETITELIRFEFLLGLPSLQKCVCEIFGEN